MTDAKSAPVESVDRALRLLLFMRLKGTVSVKDAAEHLQTAPSTAHRLLSTLAFRGFAIQDFERRYRLGPVFLDSSPTRVTDMTLREVGRQTLVDLQPKVKETVQLMVLRGGNIRFIEGIETDALLRVTMRRDDEMPAFVSAGGKAILGRMSNQEIEQLYSAGLPDWPNRRVHSLATLKRMMTKVRRDGYGISVEETEQGVIGVGVSINAPDGSPVGAVTVAVPSVRFTRDAVPFYVESLSTAAKQIENQLHNTQLRS